MLSLCRWLRGRDLFIYFCFSFQRRVYFWFSLCLDEEEEVEYGRGLFCFVYSIWARKRLPSRRTCVRAMTNTNRSSAASNTNGSSSSILQPQFPINAWKERENRMQVIYISHHPWLDKRYSYFHSTSLPFITVKDILLDINFPPYFRSLLKQFERENGMEISPLYSQFL